MHILINSVIKPAMDIDTITGCIVGGFALVLLVGLVFLSRRTNGRIERNRYRSARETLKELGDDR